MLNLYLVINAEKNFTMLLGGDLVIINVYAQSENVKDLVFKINHR